MADVSSSELVADLSKPLKGKNPTGEDIAKSEDPVANAAYSDLEMEISKVGEINYQKTAQMAVDILSNRSKHIRVAAWLCLSWFRSEELEGFKNGLSLILQLLQSFGEKLFPEKEIHRSKAVQFLSMDKRFLAIEKMEISSSEVLNEIQTILQEIDKEGKKQFTKSPPDLSTISEIISNRIKSAPSDAASEKPPVKEETAETATESSKEEKKESVPAGESVYQPEAVDQADIEIEIAEDVAKLLEDISAEQPTGINIEESDDQDTIVCYSKLESEMSKYSNNKYPECISLATEILKSRSKHLRVVVWLLIAWFRTESLDGFRNGIQLLVEMLKKYGDQLYPANQKQKARILQTLNTEARFKLLEKIKIDDKNAETFIEIGTLFSSVEEQAKALFTESPPKLNAIEAMISEKSKDAEQFQKKGIEAAHAADQPPEPVLDKESATRSASATATRPISSPTVASTDLSIHDEKSAKIAIKKGLQFYFQEGTGDDKKRKIPEDATVYGLARLLRWGKLNQPPDKDNITQIEGPNEAKQNFITKIYNNKDWDALIPEIEINFITNDSFTFWLDAQHYVVQALENKNSAFKDAATEIKLNLARLILRLPAITKFTFKDSKTLFASAETVQWIEEEVMESLGAGKSKEKILPPIMGEDYEPINKMYEDACEKLPENFAENAKSMQQAIDGETRKKGRFLRLLNLANYCYLAKKYPLAQPLFDQLMEQIEEYHISEWETALCVSVWQSTYLNNQRLLTGLKEGPRKTTIENKQKELFDKIVKYDAVLALDIESHIQNEGE